MKIIFKFSPQLERAFGGTVTDAADAMEKIEKLWNEEKESTLKEMQKITGLSFKEEVLPCYVNSKWSISNPLCIKIESLEDMLDNLIHELLHVLFTQNYSSIQEKWDAYWNTHRDLSFATKAHVPVHAVHYLVTKQLFPEHLDRIVLGGS